MRIVISGATGFIGRALTARLVDLGHELVVLSRDPGRALSLLPGIAAAKQWSPDEDVDPGLVDGVDVVFHLAGENVQGRWNQAKHDAVWASRMDGTEGIVRAIKAAESPPSVLISASGVGYYGDGGEELINEDCGPGSDYFARLCVAWEAAAMEAAGSGVRVLCPRFGMVLGAGGGALGAMKLPALAGVSGPLGDGAQWWAWIAIDDAVSALVHAMETPSMAGPFNVVAPDPIVQREFARTLGRVLGRAAFMPAPAFVLRLVLGTFAGEVLASKRVVPRRLMDAGFVHTVHSLDTALRLALGDRKPLSVLLPLIAVATLGLAPFVPEPHVFGKLRWVLGGAIGMSWVDGFDLLMHGAPWLWFIWALFNRVGAARAP